MNDLRMQIELTNHCNFRCKLCPHAYYRKGPGPSGNAFDREKGFMTAGLWRESLKAAEKHAKVLMIGYFGEQMMHPMFAERLAEIPDDHSYALMLNTNWALATVADFEVISQKVSRLKISLDTNDPATFESLCPGGGIRTLEGTGAVSGEARVKEIIRKTEAWLALKNRCRTDLVYVISEENKDQLEEFAAYWKPKIRAGDTIYQKTAISYGGVTADPFMTPYSCPTPAGRFTIAWDGTVTPCNLDVNCALSVGRFEKAEDVERILASPEWAERIEQTRRGEGICANCADANNQKNLVVIKGEG